MYSTCIVLVVAYVVGKGKLVAVGFVADFQLSRDPPDP